MQISIAKDFKDRTTADMLILPFWQGKKEAEEAFSSKELLIAVNAPLKAGDFLGKQGEVVVLYPTGQKETRLLLLGLGSKEKCTPESVRRAYGCAVKVALKKKSKTLNVYVFDRDYLNAICDGVYLSNYAFNELKGDSLKENPPTLLSKICFIGLDKTDLSLCRKADHIISSVNLTRDLVNGNADDVTPHYLGKKAKEMAKEFPKLKVTVFDKKRIQLEKMGLLLAVNQGTDKEPAFIILEYNGNPSSKDKTAIVGKGVTYDTGGLNLKPTGGMETMKCDMSGAAAVMGTLYAAAKIGLKANIVGIIPSTENAIGPNSYKPGDVYKSLSGKTIEISNTDAEGRLVLADALTYVQKHFSPTRIIDLATLTGAMVVALGEEITGCFSNNDHLAKALIEAGEKTGERVWRLPLMQDYRDMLKSSYADMKNAAGRTGGSITAALFLESFIKDTPWAHLDIAGTAYFTDAKYYHPTKATGVGVRLLIDFLENL